MTKEELGRKIKEIDKIINDAGLNAICYIWDTDGDIGGGFSSSNADIGDALVCIAHIVKRFGINPVALAVTLQ